MIAARDEIQCGIAVEAAKETAIKQPLVKAEALPDVTAALREELIEVAVQAVKTEAQYEGVTGVAALIDVKSVVVAQHAVLEVAVHHDVIVVEAVVQLDATEAVVLTVIEVAAHRVTAIIANENVLR